MNLQQALNVAVSAAIDAGAVLLSHFHGIVPCKEKGPGNIVTDADFASERLVLERIRRTFPDHRIVSEESGECGADSGPTWYIDPLDGTQNFARGLPAFCVALALAEREQIVAAVVHDPLHGETFSAARDAGAVGNKSRLRVSATAAMNRALLATGFPSPRRHRNVNTTNFADLAMNTGGIRRSGSSALDLAWLAAGRLDAVWDSGLAVWDVAAGSLLVEEAGGCVTDLAGSPWYPGCPDVVASNGLLHVELTALVAQPLRTSNVHWTG